MNDLKLKCQNQNQTNEFYELKNTSLNFSFSNPSSIVHSIFLYPFFASTKALRRMENSSQWKIQVGLSSSTCTSLY